MNLIKLISFIFIIFYSNVSFSMTEKNIVIEGNENIDNEVIYSIIGNKVTVSTEDDINEIIKTLFDTGNFKSIETEVTDDTIIIKIVENPKIRKIRFVGNKRFKRDEILSQFSEDEYFKNQNIYKIEKFLDELKNLYFSFGYNQIDIQYSILETENEGFVDLKFDFNEGKISKINKIYFVNNNAFGNNVLLSNIKSKPHNFLRFFSSSNFKNYQINNDKIRLINFYKNNGFRDISVEFKTEYLKNKNRFNVYFYITEGNKYNFGNFELKINDLRINEEQENNLLNILNNYHSSKIVKNDIYVKSSLDKISRLLSDNLYDQGVVFFDIAILERKSETIIDILYEINSIQPKYVDQINISGNTRTLDKVIRREMVFAEGDAINSELLETSLRNVKKLRIFKDVKVDEIPKSADTIDIDVQVEEQSTGEFQVGLSFGSLDGAKFVTGLKEKNISGLGRELELTINTSPDSTQYSFGLVEPHVLNKRLDFIFGANFQDVDYTKASSYNLTSFNTNTGFRYLLSDDLNHSITLEYVLKDYKITNSTTAAQSIKDLSGTNADILLKNRLVYDKLDSFIRPSSGKFISYLNVLSPVTNSDNGYLKNLVTFKNYFNYESTIFSFQSKLGNITSLQNAAIPEDNKFALGGYWLRGFDSFGVGPRNSRTSYVGGNNIIVSKFDLSRPVFKNSDNPIDLNLFFDAGTIFGNKTTPTNSNESLRSSYGLGVKFYTPIGPIGFSWAFPVTSENYDIERMFLFSIGNLN